MIDGIYMHQILNVMKSQLKGSRIEKIYHPTEKLLMFKLKNTSSSYNKLIVSLDPAFCSVHLTTLAVENPDQPSGFCMFLRKHIEGGLITDIVQQGHERLVDISIEAYNELGQKTVKILHLELMGKYSNVVLTESGLILDAIYKYPIGVNGFREILARRPYISPPLVEKLRLDEVAPELLASRIADADPGISLGSFLQQLLQGFSKSRSQSLLRDIGMENVRLSDLDSGSTAFLSGELLRYAASLENVSDDVIAELDSRYNDFYEGSRLAAKKLKLKGVAGRQLKKLEKKAAIYQDKILQEENCDLIRIKGEILSANLYRLGEKVPFIILENYYDKDLSPIRIELDESLTPAQNVKRYFKKYHKIKEGKKQSESLLLEVLAEIDYMESIRVSIESALSIGDLVEIEEELASLGLLRSSLKKKKKLPEPNYRKLVLEDGALLFIGRNNRQNDFITFKLASGGDLWFHLKDIPGPHVLLRSKDGVHDEKNMLLAAEYAASTQGGEKVQVDYALKKFVKRHPSLKLGKAVYTDFRTIVVKGGRM